MTAIVKNKRLVQLILGAAIFLGIVGLVLFPGETTGAARDGLTLCFDVIIPSLFPFFVLSSLAVELGLADYFGRALEKLMRPLFHVGGAGAIAVALGFVGGYPVGARTAISLYEKGLADKNETMRLLSFCNNSGPAFILGVVGAGIFADSSVGLLLYLSHILASLTVGILFRFYKYRQPPGANGRLSQVKVIRVGQAFSSAVFSALQSILNICAFIVFFAVVIRLLFITGIIPGVSEILAALLTPLRIDPQNIQDLITGTIEISSGMWSLKGSAADLTSQLAMAAFMLGWAGISVHCQVISFLSKSGLSSVTYIIGKALHAAVSALYAWLFCMVFSFEEPVSAYLVQQIGVIASLDFSRCLKISLFTAGTVWLLFISVIVMLLMKKHWKKYR